MRWGRPSRILRLGIRRDCPTGPFELRPGGANRPAFPLCGIDPRDKTRCPIIRILCGMPSRLTWSRLPQPRISGARTKSEPNNSQSRRPDLNGNWVRRHVIHNYRCMRPAGTSRRYIVSASSIVTQIADCCTKRNTEHPKPQGRSNGGASSQRAGPTRCRSSCMLGFC